LIVIIFIVAVILYRTLMNIQIFKAEDHILKKYATNISSITGAIINLILIIILGKVYEKLAYKLTEWGERL
jgi:hypothetical protein